MLVITAERLPLDADTVLSGPVEDWEIWIIFDDLKRDAIHLVVTVVLEVLRTHV